MRVVDYDKVWRRMAEYIQLEGDDLGGRDKNAWG